MRGKEKDWTWDVHYETAKRCVSNADGKVASAPRHSGSDIFDVKKNIV